MWSAPVQISEPATEPVSLADAKAFVSIDAEIEDFDGQLERFIGAARQQAEVVTGTRFVSQQVDLFADDWSDLERLPIGPVISVDAIEVRLTDDTLLAIPAADYVLAGAGLAQRIRSRAGAAWPSGLASDGGAIRVRLTAGYAAVPRPIRMAVLIMMADLFTHRESIAAGTVSKVPSSMQVEYLLANFRSWL